MNILVDTHALIWWWLDSPKCSPQWRVLLQDPGNEIFVSSVSAAEIAIKTKLGKLEPLPKTVAVLAKGDHFAELPFTFEHAETLAKLPLHHRDPFDRMLIAQATTEDFHVMSDDPWFTNYDVRLL